MNDDDCAPQIEWSISIEALHTRRRCSDMPPFVKVKPPKYIISPPWTLNGRNLPNFTKNNNNCVDDVQEDGPCSKKYSYLNQRKVSALLRNKNVAVPQMSSSNSMRANTQKNMSIRSVAATTSLEKIHVTDGKFVPQYPSSTDDEENESKSSFFPSYGNAKREFSKRSGSNSKYTSAGLSASSSSGKTWNGSRRSAYKTKSNNSNTGGERVNAIRKESITLNGKEESGGGRRPVEKYNNDGSIALTNEVAFGGKRDRRWYRKNSLPIRLPRGVSSNINVHSCVESTAVDKPTAPESNKMSIDPLLNYKQEEVPIFASAYEIETMPSEETEKEKIKSSKGQNQVKSSKQVEKLENKKVSRGKKKTKKRTNRGYHRKDTDNKHPSLNVTDAKKGKNVSNNRLSNKQPTQGQMVDMSSNLMAIRHLEILSLARAERERYNYPELLAWTCLLGFVLFVLLYRSEIC